MDNFVKEVSDEGYVISHGKTLEGILDELSDKEQEKYNEDVEKQAKKANKYMDVVLELLQDGAQPVPMDVYMNLRKSREHRGRFGKLFLRDVVRTIISKSNENADKLSDDIITYLQHYATKPYSWSARRLKDVLEIISRCLEYLPNSARGSNQPLSETQIKEFIMDMIPDTWKEKVALHAAKSKTELSLDGLMSYLNTIEDLEKKAKEKKELQKELEKRNAAEQKAGGRKRTLTDRIPKKGGKNSEFRDKSRQAQRHNNKERLLCKLCYKANLPEKVYGTHEDKDCKKFNSDGSEKQSKKRKHGEVHNIEVSNDMEAAFKKAALDFSKNLMQIFSSAQRGGETQPEAHVMGSDAETAIEIDDFPMDDLEEDGEIAIDYSNELPDDDTSM